VADHRALQNALWHLCPQACLPAAFSAAIVLMRAMSRRTCLTRAVFSNCPVALWKRRLNCSFFSFASSSSSWSSVIALTSAAFMTCPLLFRNALDEARLDRQLGRAQPEGLARHIRAYTVDLEHDAARL